MMTASFTDRERQIVERLIEEGVTLSAEKLGQLSSTPWTVISASVEELPVVRVLSLFREDKTPHVAAHLKSRSMLPVEILILFPEAGAKSVTEAVLRSAGHNLRLVEDPRKVVIAEISNIMGQGVLRAMANALKVSIILDVPKLREGLKSSVLGEAFGSFDGQKETVLFSRIDMSSEAMSASCSMALIFHVDLMRRLIAAVSDS